MSNITYSQQNPALVLFVERNQKTRMNLSNSTRVLLAALLSFVIVLGVLVYRANRSYKQAVQNAIAEDEEVNEVRLSLDLANFIHQLNAAAAAYNQQPSETNWLNCRRQADSVQYYFMVLAHSGTISNTDSTVVLFLTAANKWRTVNKYWPQRFAHPFTKTDAHVGAAETPTYLNDSLWMLTAALVTEQAATIEDLHKLEAKNARKDFKMLLLVAAVALVAFLIFLERIRVLFSRRNEQDRVNEELNRLLENRITERTRELEEANEQFSTINQLTSEVLWDWKIKEGKLWWNQNYYKLLGYTEEEIPMGSEQWQQVIHPDDKLRVQKSLEAAFVSGANRWEDEFRCVKANGQILHFLDRGTIFRDAQGDVIRIVGAMLDITPLRKAFETADMERILSDSLIDSLPGLFCLYNKENQLIRWNKEVMRVGGYSVEEIAESHPLQFFDKAEAEKLEAAMKLVMETGENDMETDLIVKDGTRIPYFFRGRVLQIAGEPYFISIGIDISARKQAEEAMKASEKKYRLLFYNSPMPMLMLDINTFDITDVNEAAINHYGYSRYEFLQMNARDLRPKEELERFKQEVVGQALEGTTHMGKWTHLKKNGERILVDIIAHDLKIDGENQRLILINDVTAKERAEQELRTSEKRLRDTLDNMMEGAQIISFDWRFLYLNHEAVRQSRTTYEALIGKNAIEQYPQVVDTRLYKHMERCMLLREPQMFEDEFSYADGTTCWFEFHMQPIPEGIFILSIDRTEGKRAEEQVKRAENFNHGVINAISAHLAVINKEGEIVSVNDAWRRFGELNGGEMIWNAGVGGNYLDVLRKSIAAGDLDAPIALEGILRVLQGHENFFYQEYPCHSNEEERWFAMRVVRFEADETMAVLMHEDITMRKVHVREIQESHEKLKRLTDGVPLAIYQFEKKDEQDASFKFMSRYVEQILPGVTAEEALENAFKALSRIHPDDMDEVFTSIEVSRTSLEPWHTIFRVVDDAGQFHWIEGNSTPEAIENGGVKWYGYLQDVTARIEAELAIKELNENLEHKVALRTAELMEVNKSLEDFSYSVSHDLRGPLRSILGFLDVMQQDYSANLDEDLRTLIAYAENSGKRMNAIIDDLLILAKYGKERLRLTTIDTQEMVSEIWDSLTKGGDIKAQLVIHELPAVRADASMLRQVFINLLGNAIKYSAKKAQPLIEVSGTYEDGQVVITVKDNGAGFDMKYYDRLFLAFQRLHGINEFDGTGVGLVLVKKIVEKHGGRIWAEGKVNEGARFSFTLDMA